MRLILFTVALGCALWGQAKPKDMCMPPPSAVAPSLPAQILTGQGSVHFTITTSNPEAQKFFDQGLAQMHSFWAREAERSFLQAAALDPEAPMPLWGVAMVAAGDYRPRFQLDQFRDAMGFQPLSPTHRAIQAAVRASELAAISGKATEIEKAYIAVVLARRFNLVTATISDLVARDDYEDPTSMTGLKNAMSTIWSPYDPATLDLKVVAVRQGAVGGTKAGQNYVYWGKDLISGADIPSCTSYNGLPAGLLSPGASTIVVNATYTYHTLFGVKVPGMATTTQNWTSSSSHAPRNLCVGWPTAICTTPCEN